MFFGSLVSSSSARTPRNIASEVDRVWVLEGSNTGGGSRNNREVDALEFRRSVGVPRSELPFRVPMTSRVVLVAEAAE